MFEEESRLKEERGRDGRRCHEWKFLWAATALMAAAVREAKRTALADLQ